MKKIIIAILAILILAAVYFFFFADKEKTESGPAFIMEETESFWKNQYYAAEAPLLELVDFYAEKFPHLSPTEISEEADLYTLVGDPETLSGIESEEEFMEWVEENKGLVLEVNIIEYDSTHPYLYMLQDYQQELTGKAIIVITSL